jgi:hypothetical protein
MLIASKDDINRVLMESKFFKSASELRLKSKCYDEDTWQGALNHWSAEQKRKKRVNSGTKCHTARYRHKGCACHTSSAQILAGSMLECHCGFGMCQNVSRFQLYSVLQFSFNSRDSKFVEQSVYIRNTWNTCLQGRY